MRLAHVCPGSGLVPSWAAPRPPWPKPLTVGEETPGGPFLGLGVQQSHQGLLGEKHWVLGLNLIRVVRHCVAEEQEISSLCSCLIEKMLAASLAAWVGG